MMRMKWGYESGMTGTWRGIAGGEAKRRRSINRKDTEH